MKQVTVDRVLEQIVRDVEAGDLTAIEELIADIPEEKGIDFLPDADSLSTCDACANQVPTIVGAPDGRQVCRACFDGGAA